VLISPCGGSLVDLVVAPESATELRARAARLPSLQISERAACDLELIATGGFSPLDRFMGRADHERVVEEMRLAPGHLFPIPIILPVPPGAPVKLDQPVALRDARNDLLGVLLVQEIYEWDRAAACRVFQTEDPRHPLVAEMHRWGALAVSGPMEILALPRHHDFRDLRLTPREVRARLARLGRPAVVAFQTRNPLHRAHEELTRRAARDLDGVLLLHPVVGLTKPGDIDHFSRVRTYREVARSWDEGRIVLALLPLAMRFAGPREALWHALIRRNFGCSHLIVGRNHASPGVDSQGQPFYGPLEAQELVARFAAELGVQPVPFSEMVYLPGEDRYEESSRVPAGVETRSLSGTEVREAYLKQGRPLPAWFTRPEVAAILHESHPPPDRQGVCIWFTGLSGAGKSTTADVLTVRLLERGRTATVLDGDVVRTHLSKGLGFTKEDRETNVRRIGFVAAEIVRHGGVAICAAVSPYRATRDEVRSMVGAPRFFEVFVDTPLEVCEARDQKGMYAKARRGELRSFTGIDDPYEPPLSPTLRLETTERSAEENAELIVAQLEAGGFVRRSGREP
jgi:sulfate adenylyltransferase